MKQAKISESDVVRIRMTDTLNAVLMLLVVLCLTAIMIYFEKLGWFDSIGGGILSVILGGLLVTSMFDVGYLLSACITISGGVVNAGRSPNGDQLVFHLHSLSGVELRKKDGSSVEENKKYYRNVDIAFIMDSGRVNIRHVGRISNKQLNNIRHVLKEMSRSIQRTEK